MADPAKYKRETAPEAGECRGRAAAAQTRPLQNSTHLQHHGTWNYSRIARENSALRGAGFRELERAKTARRRVTAL